MCLLVPGVPGNQWQSDGGFAINHLLEGSVYLAPGTGFLERARGERSVAHIGYRDLDRVLVHGRLGAQDIRGNDNVLREVLGYATADHQQARGGVGDLELRQLVEVLGGIERYLRLVAACVL